MKTNASVSIHHQIRSCKMTAERAKHYSRQMKSVQKTSQLSECALTHSRVQKVILSQKLLVLLIIRVKNSTKQCRRKLSELSWFYTFVFCFENRNKATGCKINKSFLLPKTRYKQTQHVFLVESVVTPSKPCRNAQNTECFLHGTKKKCREKGFSFKLGLPTLTC